MYELLIPYKVRSYAFHILYIYLLINHKPKNYKRQQNA